MLDGADALMLAAATYVIFVLASTLAFWALLTPTRKTSLTQRLDSLVLRATQREVRSSASGQERASPTPSQTPALAVPLAIALIGQGLIAQYLLAGPGGISESARAILVGELALSVGWLAVLLVQWVTAEPVQ